MPGSAQGSKPEPSDDLVELLRRLNEYVAILRRIQRRSTANPDEVAALQAGIEGILQVSGRLKKCAIYRPSQSILDYNRGQAEAMKNYHPAKYDPAKTEKERQ